MIALKLLQCCHFWQQLMVITAYLQVILPLPSLSAICYLTPKPHPLNIQTSEKNALLSISPFFLPSSTSFFRLYTQSSDFSSGVLRCSLIRACSMGCHYLSTVSGTMGAVQYYFSTGRKKYNPMHAHTAFSDGGRGMVRLQWLHSMQLLHCCTFDRSLEMYFIHYNTLTVQMKVVGNVLLFYIIPGTYILKLLSDNLIR